MGWVQIIIFQGYVILYPFVYAGRFYFFLQKEGFKLNQNALNIKWVEYTFTFTGFPWIEKSILWTANETIKRKYTTI